MADIQDIAQILITIQDRTATTPNFGRVLIAAHEPGVGQDRVYQYNLGTAATDMLADGFTAGNPAYRMVQSMSSQTPSSADVLVYSRATALSHSVTFTPQTSAAGTVFEIVLDDAVISYTALVGDTTTDVATALHTQADALATVASTDNGASFTVVPDGVSVKVAIGNAATRGYDPALIGVATTAADVSLATELDTLADIVPADFYGIATDADDDINMAALATWAEANKKLALMATSDRQNTLPDLGIGAQLRDAGFNYAVTLFTESPGAYPMLALASRQLSKTPGSSTWALQPGLSGVPFSTLTAGQLANLRANRLITYTQTRGVAHTLDGFAASGRFVDLTRGIDWLDAEIETEVFTLLVNAEKIPYTVAGISAVRGAITAALLRGARRGVVTLESINVQMPSLDEISSADRSLRQLCDIRFTAIAQGAIHKVKVNGVVSV